MNTTELAPPAPSPRPPRLKRVVALASKKYEWWQYRDHYELRTFTKARDGWVRVTQARLDGDAPGEPEE